MFRNFGSNGKLQSSPVCYTTKCITWNYTEKNSSFSFYTEFLAVKIEERKNGITCTWMVHSLELVGRYHLLILPDPHYFHLRQQLLPLPLPPLLLPPPPPPHHHHHHHHLPAIVQNKHISWLTQLIHWVPCLQKVKEILLVDYIHCIYSGLQIIFFSWKDMCPTKSPFRSDKTKIRSDIILQYCFINEPANPTHCQLLVCI